MNRLQNFLIVIWTLALLLFVAFNWQLVQQPVGVGYLFMDFNLPVVLWLLVAGFGMPFLIRILATMDRRALLRRTEKEIMAIKAKAFDGSAAKLEGMMTQLQDNLEQKFRAVLSSESAAKPALPAVPAQDSPSAKTLPPPDSGSEPSAIKKEPEEKEKPSKSKSRKK